MPQKDFARLHRGDYFLATTIDVRTSPMGERNCLVQMDEATIRHGSVLAQVTIDRAVP